jgi:hypothetical protein
LFVSLLVYRLAPLFADQNHLEQIVHSPADLHCHLLRAKRRYGFLLFGFFFPREQAQCVVAMRSPVQCETGVHLILFFCQKQNKQNKNFERGT